MSSLDKTISRLMARIGYRAYGIDAFGRLNWLQGANNWTLSERTAWRLTRLNKILEYCRAEIAFYRGFWGDHHVSAQPLQHLEELQRYPILRKDVVRANVNKMRPANVDKIRCIKKHTGGSTSVPVHYLLDVEQWELMEAFHIWSWMQMGYEFGDRVGVIAGGSLVPEKMTLKTRLRNYATGRLFLYGVAMDSELARKYHGQLIKHGAKFLYGYPSVLYLFAKHLHEQNLKLSLRGAVTTAEMLLPNYRRGIESWLECPVYDNLGSNDGGFESYECRLHNGFHYNDLQAILEIDPSDHQNDGKGRIIITNLWNRSTPFVRYENGDLATLTNEPCECGSKFPRVASIEGRTTDILTFSNGRSLSGPALTLIFGDMQIDGWQVVQTAPDRVEVRLCTSGSLDPEYDSKIRRVIGHHLNGGVTIDVRAVEKLQLTKGGKLKPVWSEVEAAR